MNYSEIKTFDIANGIGVRTSLFVSGCRNKCPECFNPETWDFNYGKPFTETTINYILGTLEPVYIDGLSILGGEPFELENQPEVFLLADRVKNEFPSKTIWVWTGFTFNDILDNTSCRACTYTSRRILEVIDILVDGPFKKEKKDLLLRFRGSSNQRIIDVQKSLESEQAILWKDDPIFDSHKWED